MCAFLGRYHYHCDASAITLRLPGISLQPSDTADTLGVGNTASLKVEVAKRGFLHAQLRYLHNGKPLDGLVPDFNLYFRPAMTIEELRRRLANVMDTDASLVKVFEPDADDALAGDDRFVREWWGTTFRNHTPLLFSGSPRDPNPIVRPDQWRMYFFRYERCRPLGGGGFGTAVQMIDPVTYHMIALKTVTNPYNLHQVAYFQDSKDFREVRALIQFNHPCILSILGWDFADGKLQIGTEFLEGGSLDAVITAKKAGGEMPGWYDATAVAIIVTGIVLGMRHIHARKAIHRDFKPGNVLLDGHGRPQIGDLGLCRDFGLEMTGVQGTKLYWAPELIIEDQEDKYTQAVDVFAFGLVLYELLVGEKVYKSRNELALGKEIEKGIRPDIPDFVEPVARGIIDGWWQMAPPARPSLHAVFNELKAANFMVLKGVDAAEV
jgi:serine/threonine-protein kinase